MDKNKLEKLLRLLDFIQRDFTDVTTPIERRIACLEIGELLQNGYFLSAGDFTSETAPFVIQDGATPINPAVAIWESVQNYCDQLVDLIDVIHQTTMQGGHISFDREITFSFKGDPANSIFEQHTTRFSHMIKPSNVWYTFPGQQKTFVLKTSTLAEAVFDLFDGIPVSRLKKCPDCSNFFIQKTAREKIYCSVLCKNRHIVKQKDAQKEKRGEE